MSSEQDSLFWILVIMVIVYNYMHSQYYLTTQILLFVYLTIYVYINISRGTPLILKIRSSFLGFIFWRQNLKPVTIFRPSHNLNGRRTLEHKFNLNGRKSQEHQSEFSQYLKTILILKTYFSITTGMKYVPITYYLVLIY